MIFLRPIARPSVRPPVRPPDKKKGASRGARVTVTKKIANAEVLRHRGDGGKKEEE